MLIQIVQMQALIPRTGEGIAFVRGEIQPQISMLEGCGGFSMALDRASGGYVGFTTWTDRDALTANASRALGLIRDASSRLQTGEPSIEVFDVASLHVVRPVRVGYRGRLSRAEVSVADLDRGVRKFDEMVSAVFERHNGLAVIGLFVDHARGVVRGVVWCESAAALRGSVPLSEELLSYVSPVQVTDKAIDHTELEVVFAEMASLPDSGFTTHVSGRGTERSGFVKNQQEEYRW